MDKFIWAMAVFAAILALVIGGGFTALEYLKQSPYTVKQEAQDKITENTPTSQVTGKTTASESGKPPENAGTEKTAGSVSIIGVGDIMLGSNYPAAYLPDTNILKNIESVLQDADITVGNLEGTLFDEGGTPKKCADPKICPLFRTPSSYGQYLADAGFDYLNLANDHINDFGEQGIMATAVNLEELNIKFSGIENKFETAILKKNGVKYGFVSFAASTAAVKLNDYAKAQRLIAQTKEKTDIVIVMFHVRTEGRQAGRTPTFLYRNISWGKQRKCCRVCKAGCRFRRGCRIRTGAARNTRRRTLQKPLYLVRQRQPCRLHCNRQ